MLYGCQDERQRSEHNELYLFNYIFSQCTVDLHARISSGKIDPQSTSTSTEKKDEVTIITIVSLSIISRLFCVVNVHLPLAFINFGTAINAAVLPVAKDEVIFDDIEEGSHLTKDEDLMFVFEEPLKHPIQQSEFATGFDE